MKQKLLEMIQVTVWLHTDEFISGTRDDSSGGRTLLPSPSSPLLTNRIAQHSTSIQLF